MRRPPLLLLARLTVLCLAQMKVAAFCYNECDSLNAIATRDKIQVTFPPNSTIYNVTSANGQEVPISSLDPGTLYTVYFTTPNGTCCKSITTEPSPVSNLQVVNITETTVTLEWKNDDNASSEYSYVVLYTQNENAQNVTVRGHMVTIERLEPGTFYNFSVALQTGDNKTTEPEVIGTYTKPNPVSDLQVVEVTTATVTLRWKNNDTASSGYSYVVLYTQNGTLKNVTTPDKNVTIQALEPGTFYNFSVFPQVGASDTPGESQSISTYTKPTPVVNITIEIISTTAVHLWWNTSDPNPQNYTYNIEIERNGDTRKDIANTTSAIIGNLVPGTLYTFTIYPVVGANKTQGDPKNETIYTKPSPVSDLQVVNVTTATVTLSWKNDDNASSEYTYIVLYEQNEDLKNETTRGKVVTIKGLEPGTHYNFSVSPRAGDNHTAGEPQIISQYTKPSPVSDLHVVNVTNTTVTLSWKNDDTASSEYSYIVLYTQNQTAKNVTFQDKVVTIRGLEPGTLYNFSVSPQAGDNVTTGEPEITSTYTKPSPVSDLQAVNVTKTTVTLSWKNDDNPSSEYSYIVLYTQNKDAKNVTSQKKDVTIKGLEPGTLYNFSVSPLAGDNVTTGKPENTNIYTVPSSVFNISIKEVSTTVVILSWRNPDVASDSYIYRIHTSVENKNITVSNQDATIMELKPGTMYTFNIYSVAADNKTEGNPEGINVITDPDSVGKLDCTLVIKKPELYLNWSGPAGRYDNFSIKISNENWTRVNYCTPEQRTITLTNLNYFTSYNVSIITHSFTKESIPREVTCLTSIGDPPPLTDSPVVSATTYNSMKVRFNRFDSSHGPLKAYAVIILKSTGVNLNESLNYTYHDFINRKTDAYVAYITDTQKRSTLSDSQHLDILIGNGSTTHGYFNGELDPLCSYRACVAGFTHIDFLKEEDGLIVSEKSYFSFSPLSNPVTLPQNPAVITGAVCGCLLGAVAVAAVAGFIFWKKRRKHQRNNDVIFAPIEPKKSKLLKVENFESYYKKQKADSNCGFAEEYEDLRMVGVNQPKFAAELAENKGKNRYNNVLPYDISRVKLSIQNHPTNDYINANYMPGYNSKKEFIAAQGPLPNTVQDFWRMIWEKNIYTIVMLTKCVEQGRTKCEEYWPNKQSKNYGDITVAMTSEIVLPEWTIRDFSMEKSDSLESHPVRQFHFTAWPDHGVPEATDLLINFRHLVQDYMKQNPPTSPTLVHCSAGVGRTGTFIAIDRLIHQMEMENTVDVYGVVYDLRMHRSLMVQTEDQYIFLNQCVLDIIKSQKEKKADLIYQNTNAMAIYENFTPSPHTGKANGYHV